MQPIPILYEEPHFLLANKPAALFSQAPDGIDSLQSRLVEQLKARDQHPGEPFVGLPHRLDRGTSGIMLIARNQRALKRFGEQFQSRKVIKHYLAVVSGEFSSVNLHGANSEQTWQDYLRKVPDQARAEVVDSEVAGAKLAVARVKCLHSVDGQSLLCLQLETGRMHQIRIQSSSRGMPVVGDTSYGARLPWVTNEDPHAHPPIALHAWSLEFRHPQTAKALRFVAPVPDYWQQLPEPIFSRIQMLTAGTATRFDVTKPNN